MITKSNVHCSSFANAPLHRSLKEVMRKQTVTGRNNDHFQLGLLVHKAPTSFFKRRNFVVRLGDNSFYSKI